MSFSGPHSGQGLTVGLVSLPFSLFAMCKGLLHKEWQAYYHYHYYRIIIIITRYPTVPDPSLMAGPGPLMDIRYPPSKPVSHQ